MSKHREDAPDSLNKMHSQAWLKHMEQVDTSLQGSENKTLCGSSLSWEKQSSRIDDFRCMFL